MPDYELQPGELWAVDTRGTGACYLGWWVWDGKWLRSPMGDAYRSAYEAMAIDMELWDEDGVAQAFDYDARCLWPYIVEQLVCEGLLPLDHR